MALLTYSTKPRGGVVHTLALAEALHALGQPVHVLALGDPDAGFFRPLRAPMSIVPGPSGGGTIEQSVAASIDALAAALEDVDADVLHAQTASARVLQRACATRVLRSPWCARCITLTTSPAPS
ncbi:MAG: glycosyltransferase [Actinobacteria bacterium]|nr:glycosyltransferase [Actinomycetota bacterium]MBW3646957.1 glycosyltransferase [Actinomycetota bacterium]